MLGIFFFFTNIKESTISSTLNGDQYFSVKSNLIYLFISSKIKWPILDPKNKNLCSDTMALV